MTAMEYPLPLVALRQFGDRYLVRGSEEYDGPKKIPEDPFFQMIPRREGMSIWPYGAQKLRATVQAKYLDRLLATGFILERESAICRDDPSVTDPALVPPGVKPHEWRAQCERLERPRAEDLVSIVVFQVEHLDAVAEIIGARRRRKLSPEHRAAATERLRRLNEERKTRPERESAAAS